MFHGSVYEFFQFGERHYLVELGGDFPLAHAQDRAAQKRVFAAREFGMESSADFEQAADAPMNFRPTDRWLRDARKNLQQRRFSRPVAPDEPKYFSLVHFQRNIFKCPEGFLLLPLQGMQRRLQHPSQRISQQPIGLRDAAAIALS